MDNALHLFMRNNFPTFNCVPINNGDDDDVNNNNKTANVINLNWPLDLDQILPIPNRVSKEDLAHDKTLQSFYKTNAQNNDSYVHDQINALNNLKLKCKNLEQEILNLLQERTLQIDAWDIFTSAAQAWKQQQQQQQQQKRSQQHPSQYQDYFLTTKKLINYLSKYFLTPEHLNAFTNIYAYKNIPNALDLLSTHTLEEFDEALLCRENKRYIRGKGDSKKIQNSFEKRDTNFYRLYTKMNIKYPKRGLNTYGPTPLSSSSDHRETNNKRAKI